MRWVPWRRSRARSGHIIISGTGRAGTTFLVQYFTAVGLDTGYSLEEAISGPDVLSRGGLERSLSKANLPHVIKSPWFSDVISEALSDKKVEIEAAVIPVRDLFSAAESRRRVYRQVAVRGGNPLAHPGTVWKTENPDEQEVFLAMQFYKVIEPLVAHKVPIHFLHFPSFVRSHERLYDGLRAILGRHGISRRQSETAYRKVVDTSLIHEFKPQDRGQVPGGGACSPALSPGGLVLHSDQAGVAAGGSRVGGHDLLQGKPLEIVRAAGLRSGS